MEVALRVDEALPGPAVVFGSLPPGGRDLDLLVRRDVFRAAGDALRADGFAGAGGRLALLTERVVFGVDLVAVEEWGAGAEESAAVFADAVPLDGYRHLHRPAPHHVLLIAARRVVRSGVLDAKRRARVRDALIEDAGAWERAQERAAAWHAERALDVLRAALEGEPVSRRMRTDALADELGGRGNARPKARALAMRQVARGGRGGAAVALSGLDGSGKTTQGEAVRDALRDLGYEVEYVWTKVGRDPSLRRLAAPVKSLLREESPAPAGDGSVPIAATGPPPSSAQARAGSLSRRNPVVNLAWTSLVALFNAKTQRAAVRDHLKAGRVVICDRYVLDTAAHLRYRYGPQRRYRVQVALNRSLSPRPLRSYLLEVTPEVAIARKHEQYDLEQLTLLALLYREEADRLGVERLDGTLPPGELKLRIVREVWESLG